MNETQRQSLRALCERYGVEYDEANYTQVYELPTGWVAGWVGPIYVGCSPEGEIHS